MKVIGVLLHLILACDFCAAQSSLETPGTYPEGSTRLLTAPDLTGKSAAELRRMRNEIFARHGYRFHSNDLKTHFEAQAWYKPCCADVTEQLTELEKKNITFIKQVESQMTAAQNSSTPIGTAPVDTAFALLPDDFKKFWSRFRNAVAQGNREAVASLALYPMDCEALGVISDKMGNAVGSKQARSKAALLSVYGNIFTDAAIEAIATGTPDTHWRGGYKINVNHLYSFVFGRSGDGYRWTGYYLLVD